jgi:hypothetical protein
MNAVHWSVKRAKFTNCEVQTEQVTVLMAH